MRNIVQFIGMIGLICATSYGYAQVTVPPPATTVIVCHTGVPHAGCPLSASQVRSQVQSVAKETHQAARQVQSVARLTGELKTQTEELKDQTQLLAQQTGEAEHRALAADAATKKQAATVEEIRRHSVYMWIATAIMVMELLVVGVMGFLVVLKLYAPYS